MASPDMNKLMADLIASARSMPTSPTPSHSNIAKSLMLFPTFEGTKEHPAGTGGGHGGMALGSDLARVGNVANPTSVISRIIDLIERPAYAIGEPTRRALAHPGKTSVGELLGGVGAGLTGKKKTTGFEILEEHGVKGVPLAVGGFALSLGMDPTTYIPGGALLKGTKAASRAAGLTKAKEAIPEAERVFTLTATGAPKKIPGGKIEISEASDQPLAAHRPVEHVVSAPGDEATFQMLAPKEPVIGLPTDPIDVAVAQKVASEYGRKLKIKNKTLTAKQQGTIFRNLLGKTGNDPVKSLSLLKEAERYHESQGLLHTLHDGTRGKLSEVIDEMGGPDAFLKRVRPVGEKKTRVTSPELYTGPLHEFETGKVQHPDLVQAHEILRNRGALEGATREKEALDEIMKIGVLAKSTLSQPKAENVISNLMTKVVQNTRREAIMSPVELEHFKGVLTEIHKLGEGTIQLALDDRQSWIKAIVKGDKLHFQDISESVARDRELAHGFDYKKLADEVDSRKSGWVHTLASMFSTWYGNPELRGNALRTSVLARNSAALRDHALEQMFAHNPATGVAYTPNEIKVAFDSAKGLTPTDDPLALNIRNWFEDLYSSTGIEDEAHSVALRSGTTMKDANAELSYLGQKYPPVAGFKFTDDPALDEATGLWKDYSGENWLKSWQEAKIDDPRKFMTGIATAVESLTKRYAMVDEMSLRFGSKLPKPGWITIRETGDKHALWRTAGYYFPPEIAEQIPRMFKVLDDLYVPPSKLGKLFDTVQGMWKRGVTLPMPSHHIRNLEGDVFIAWLDGVTNPKWYKMGMQVMRKQRARYKSGDISLLVGREPLQQTAKAKVLFHTRGGIPITDEMLYHSAFHEGLLLGARDIEDIMGDDITHWPQWMHEGKGPAGGKVYNRLAKFAEGREHFAILAHYAYGLSKSKEKNLAKLYEQEGRRVKKFHPNGTDLTGFERGTMRRIFPFYSWTRKAMPLLIESLLFNPRKIITVPRAQLALQKALGIEGTTISDPFPTDQGFPDWMREQGMGPMGAPGMPGLAGLIGGLGRQNPSEPGAYTIAGENVNPFMQLMGQFTPSGNQGPTAGFLQSANPALQAFYELSRNENILTGAPVLNNSAQWAIEKTPLAPLSRILNKPGVQGAPGKRRNRPGINMEALLNTLTAAGIRGTGPYIPGAERGGR